MSSSGIPLTYYPGDNYLLIVGGGSAAVGKLRALSPFAPRIRLVAPCIRPEIQQLKTAFRELQLHHRPFLPEDTHNVALAYVFTDNPQVNQHITLICRKKGIPVNCAAAPAALPDQRTTQRDFSSPASLVIDEYTISVSSGGITIKGAVQLRDHIHHLLQEYPL